MNSQRKVKLKPCCDIISRYFNLIIIHKSYLDGCVGSSLEHLWFVSIWERLPLYLLEVNIYFLLNIPSAEYSLGRIITGFLNKKFYCSNKCAIDLHYIFIYLGVAD